MDVPRLTYTQPHHALTWGRVFDLLTSRANGENRTYWQVTLHGVIFAVGKENLGGLTHRDIIIRFPNRDWKAVVCRHIMDCSNAWTTYVSVELERLWLERIREIQKRFPVEIPDVRFVLGRYPDMVVFLDRLERAAAGDQTELLALMLTGFAP